MNEGQEPRVVSVSRHLFAEDAEHLSRRDSLGFGEDLQHMLALNRVGCWRLRLVGRVLQATSCFRSLYELPPRDPIDFDCLLAAISAEDRGAFLTLIDHAAATEAPLVHEHRVALSDGRTRWLGVRARATDAQDGENRSLFGIVQDVTERRIADEDHQFAARELNHRVTNSFALTQAIVAQTIRNAKSIREIGRVLELRLAALAAANDLLLGSAAPSAAIVDVLRRVLLPFGFGYGEQFTWAGPDVLLPPRIVAALSLGLHELATNACKYGALSAADGEVRLVWTIGETRLRLVWEERCGPLVVPPLQVGFGTKLIEHCLGRHVGGVTAISYRPAGVCFTADLPLDLVVVPGDSVIAQRY